MASNNEWEEVPVTGSKKTTTEEGWEEVPVPDPEKKKSILETDTSTSTSDSPKKLKGWQSAPPSTLEITDKKEVVPGTHIPPSYQWNPSGSITKSSGELPLPPYKGGQKTSSEIKNEKTKQYLESNPIAKITGEVEYKPAEEVLSISNKLFDGKDLSSKHSFENYLTRLSEVDPTAYGEMKKNIENGVDEKTSFRYIDNALKWKETEVANDFEILKSRGAEGVAVQFEQKASQIEEIDKEYKKDYDQFKLLEWDLEQVRAEMGTSVDPIRKDALTTMESDILSQMEQLSPRIQEYIDKRKPLEDDYNSFVAQNNDLLKQFGEVTKDANDIQKEKYANLKMHPEEFKKDAQQKGFENFRKMDWGVPLVKQQYEISAEVWNRVVDNAMGLITFGKDFGFSPLDPAGILSPLMGDDYEKVKGDATEKITGFMDSYLKLPASKEPLLKENGSVDYSRVAPLIAGTATDMAILLAGTKGMSAGMGGAKWAQTASLIGSSMLQTYDDYKNVALQNGYSEKDAIQFGLYTSALVSSLEVLSPNKIIRGTNLENLALRTAFQELKKKGWKGSMKTFYDVVIKEIGQENLQELSQGFAEKVANRVMNTVASDDTKMQLEEKMSNDEIFETILLTTAVTGLMSGGAGYINKGAYRNSALRTAAEHFDGFQKMLQDGVAQGKIDPQMAEKLTKEVTDTVVTLQQMPDDLAPEKKDQLSPLFKEKNALLEKIKVVDPVFAEGLKEQIGFIDEQIKKVVNAPSPKPKETEEKPVETTEQKTKVTEKKEVTPVVAEEKGVYPEGFDKVRYEDLEDKMTMEDMTAEEVDELNKQREQLKLEPYDKKNLKWLSGEKQKGQEPVGAEPDKTGGDTKAEAGGVLQTPEEKKGVTKYADLDDAGKARIEEQVKKLKKELGVAYSEETANSFREKLASEYGKTGKPLPDSVVKEIVSYTAGITTATSRIPEIDEKLKKAQTLESEGKHKDANKLYNEVLDIGEKVLHDSVKGIEGVSIKVHRTKGNFFGETEPTFKVEIDAEKGRIEEVMKRLSGVAQSWKQMAVHVSRLERKPQGAKWGDPQKDGSVYEPGVELAFDREISDSEFAEISKEIQKTGLAGGTLHPDKKGITLYNVTKYGTKAEEFLSRVQAIGAGIVRATKDNGGVRTVAKRRDRRLFNIGEEGAADILYGEVGSGRYDKPQEQRRSKVEKATPELLDKLVKTLQKAFPKTKVVTDTSEIDRVLSQMVKDKAVSKLQEASPPLGFVYKGVVYIDPRVAKADTPIHEFGHIWNKFTKENFPEFYKRGLELVKGTEYEQRVRELYPHLITSEDILEEALATAIGERGAKITNGARKKRFQQWIKTMWDKIAEALNLKMSGQRLSELTLDKYTTIVAGKLLSGEAVDGGGQVSMFVAPQKETSAYTITFLSNKAFKQFGGKQIKKDYIVQQLKQQGVKDIEKILVLSVLDTIYSGQEKFSFDEFVRSVQDQVMPLDKIRTDSYATYGSENIGMDDMDSQETIIFNSPVVHGETGHFSGDFNKKIGGVEWEVKELQDGLYAAVDKNKPANVTESDIMNYVGTVGNKAAVEKWIEARELAEGQPIKKGLFGHIRVWREGETYNVAELQSDAFQKDALDKIEENIDTLVFDEAREEWSKYNLDLANKIRETIYPGSKFEVDEKEARVVEKDGTVIQRNENGKFPGLTSEVGPIVLLSNSKLIKLYKEKVGQDVFNAVLEGYRKGQADINARAKERVIAKMRGNRDVYKDQFEAHKKNYTLRLLREAVKDAALSGAKILRIPSPRTIATIEGFVTGSGNRIPYEIMRAADHNRLEPGDRIEYNGDSMTVVDADNYRIKIVREDNANVYRVEDLEEDYNNMRVEDAIYEVEKEFVDPTAVTLEEIKRAVEAGRLGHEVTKYLEEVVDEKEDDFADGGTVDIRDGLADAVIRVTSFDVDDYAQGLWGIYGRDWFQYENQIFVPNGDVEELMQPDEYEQVSGSDEEFSLNVLSDTQRSIVEKYVELEKLFKKERKDARKIEQNGYTWLETDITDNDAISPVVAFQIDLKSALTGMIEKRGVSYQEALNKAKSTATWKSMTEEEQKEFDLWAEEKYGEKLKEDAPIGKEKSLLNRVYKAKNVSAETKRKIAQFGLSYTQFTNEESQQIADAIIAEAGIEKAYVLVQDMSNEIRGAVRTMLYARIINHYYEQEQKAKTEDQKEKFASLQADVANALDEYARDSGQAIQALSSFYKMSPLGIELKIRRQIEKVNEEEMTKKRGIPFNKSSFRDNINKLKDALKEASGIPVQKKTSGGKKNVFTMNMEERNKKIQELKDRWKNRKGGKLTSGGLDPEAIEIAGELGMHYIAKGVVNFAQWSKKMMSDLGITEQQAKEVWEKHRIPKEDDEKNRTLKDFVNEEMKEVAKDQKLKLLDKMFPETKEQKKNPKKRKQEHEKILEGIEALTDEDGDITDIAKYERLFYTQLGLVDTTTPDAMAKLKEFSNRISESEGLYKDKATVEMLDYLANLKKESRAKLIMPIMYANMLYGYETHLRNFQWNLYSSMLFHMGMLAVRKPMHAKTLLKAFVQGLKKGQLEARDILATGQEKTGSPISERDLMERTEKKGFWKVLNHYVIPFRLLRSSDALFNSGLTEAKTAHLLIKEMKARNKELPEDQRKSNKDIEAEINNIIFGTQERLAESKAKAERETMKFYDIKEPMFIDGKRNPALGSKYNEAYRNMGKRVYQLMEESRPQEATADAKDWAERALLMGQPKGYLGIVAKGLSTIFGAMPAVKMFTMPFVNVPMNVANFMIDWSPLGFINVLAGKEAPLVPKEQLKKLGMATELTNDQKRELVIKASVSTAAMTVLYLLTQIRYDDDEEGERPVLIVYGDGVGDWAKNQELRKVKHVPGTDYQVNFEPFTVDLFGMRLSYKSSPFIAWFASMGYVGDYERFKGGEESTMVKKITMGMYGHLMMTSEQANLSGLRDLLNVGEQAGQFADDATAMEKMGKNLEKTGYKMLRNMVLPNYVSQANTDVRGIMDMTDKRAINPWEVLIKDVPFADGYLVNRQDHFGRPVKDEFAMPFVPSGGKPEDKFYQLVFNKEYGDKLKFYNDKTIFRLDDPMGVQGAEYEISRDEVNKINTIRGEYVRKALEDPTKHEDLGGKTTYEYLNSLTPDEFDKAFGHLFSQGTWIAKDEVFGQGLWLEKEGKVERTPDEKLYMRNFKRMYQYEEGVNLRKKRQRGGNTIFF